MKKEFSFIIGEGKDRLSCSDEFDKQKRRVMENDKCWEFIGEPQFIEPTNDDEAWLAYQQYTYEVDEIISTAGDESKSKKEDVVCGSGKSFFLCCCDLNNRIRVKRWVLKNVEIVGVPCFIKPAANEKLWKATQEYLYEPDYVKQW